MTEVIQYLIPTGSMRLDEGKLLIGQLTGLVKDIVRNTNLSDVVHEGNVVVLLHRLIIITKLPGKHFGIPGHTQGVALCVEVITQGIAFYEFARFFIDGVNVEDNMAAVLFNLIDVEILEKRSVMQYVSSQRQRPSTAPEGLTSASAADGDTWSEMLFSLSLSFSPFAKELIFCL